MKQAVVLTQRDHIQGYHIQGWRLDLRQVVRVMSDALDWVGVNTPHHGKRVAFMASRIGMKLGLDEGTLDDLAFAAMLHDIGISSTRALKEILLDSRSDYVDVHARRGSELVGRLRPLAHLAPVVRHHHQPWDGFAELSRPVAEKTRILANVIFLADRIDAFLRMHDDPLMARDPIARYVDGNDGALFMPEAVAAFRDLLPREEFWIAQEPEGLGCHFDAYASRSHYHELAFDDFRDMAVVFAMMVDAKSRFTAEHSYGVARLAVFLGERLGLPSLRREMLEIAALLHDIGKLRIPDDVLDKPGPLTSEERAVIKRHSYYGYQILSRIEGLDRIATWAGAHHERMDGEGYPFHCKGPDIPLEARILAVADVFQTLAQARPYRAAAPAETISSVLGEMARDGKLDAGIVSVAREHLDECRAFALGHRDVDRDW